MSNAPMKTGDAFNEWTVIDPHRRIVSATSPDGTQRNRAAALARCSCGTEKVIHQHHLRSGNTKSCGHIRREVARNRTRARTMHSRLRVRCRSETRESGQRRVIRSTWASMKDRCMNPGNTHYEDYGGRGISVHPAWLDDSDAFIDWILENLGPRPDDRLPSGRAVYSLDRIAVNGNYEPLNLRWADQHVQMANTRSQLEKDNGVHRVAGAGTWAYTVVRAGVKLIENGFSSPEDAARGRDETLGVLEAEGEVRARELIRTRTDARIEARRDAIRQARQTREHERQEAREARRAERRQERDRQTAERQARNQERMERSRLQAETWAEMNRSGLSLSDVARAEGVTTAYVSAELRRHGIPVVRRNATGYPGVHPIRGATRPGSSSTASG